MPSLSPVHWDIDDDIAWARVGPGCYRHYSGASLIQKGKLWNAINGMMKKERAARKNIRANRLLPRSLVLIMKAYIKTLRRETRKLVLLERDTIDVSAKLSLPTVLTFPLTIRKDRYSRSCMRLDLAD
jgi:hypothetical protein